MAWLAGETRCLLLNEVDSEVPCSEPGTGLGLPLPFAARRTSQVDPVAFLGVDEIDAEFTTLTEYREKPAGNVRIAAGEHSAESIIWPALERLLPEYPDVTAKVVVDNGLTNIVAERLDAGVRLGEQVDKDMVAVRIGPDLRMAAVAAPSYFERRRKPRTPDDLTDHVCINLRLQTRGVLHAWEFERG